MNAIFNTGTIQDEGRSREVEYVGDGQEVKFSAEQHTIWTDLFTAIDQADLTKHICNKWHEGMENLAIPSDHIPTVAHLNSRITSRTGWQIERTVVRYTKADDWYTKFAQRTFLITDYIRTREQMAFTPEPDMFHDIFGHLPFLTLGFYARIEELFAPAYFNATDEEREVIRRLAWYSTEFGLVMEQNRPKIFGAGIISGHAELLSTIEEFERLERDGVLDYSGNVYGQICDNFFEHEEEIDAIFDGINRLHAQGEMSNADNGWNVIRGLYDELGIACEGYFGGNVLLAPFDIDYISRIPKTVYAMNPVFFVFESFEKLEAVLAGYLRPIAERA